MKQVININFHGTVVPIEQTAYDTLKNYIETIKRFFANELTSQIGTDVLVSGWVHARRDHGGVIFIDLRDHTGLVQLVINPDQEAVFNLAESLRDEFVISATGQVRERGEGLVNPNIDSGSCSLYTSDAADE